MDNDNKDSVNKQADAILNTANQKTLLSEYERAYDIISRMMVWYAMPVAARNQSRKTMYRMCRDFMRTAHDPYLD